MWNKVVIFLLLFYTFSILFKSDQSFNQDLGRHLKLGEIIMQTGEVPRINLFSYIYPSFPFINTHWLFEVFVYLFSKLIGFQALLIFKVDIIMLSVWIILKTIPKEKLIGKLKVISIAPLLAETIKRTHEGLPMGVVYEEMYKKLEKKLK